MNSGTSSPQRRTNFQFFKSMLSPICAWTKYACRSRIITSNQTDPLASGNCRLSQTRTIAMHCDTDPFKYLKPLCSQHPAVLLATCKSLKQSQKAFGTGGRMMHPGMDVCIHTELSYVYCLACATSSFIP